LIALIVGAVVYLIVMFVLIEAVEDKKREQERHGHRRLVRRGHTRKRARI
jgi:hypothetical protein